MARRYEVRVREEKTALPLVQAAGQRFPRCEATIVHEGNPGLAEIRANPLLEVVALRPTPEAEEVAADAVTLPGIEEGDDEAE